MTLFESPTDQKTWEESRPLSVRSDLLWKLDLYRAAAYLSHLATGDAEVLLLSRPSIAEQLRRAAASVGANIAEGYSRSSKIDRIRFIEYALGSARECVSWYQAAEGVLPLTVIETRLELLALLRRLALGLIKSLRRRDGMPSFTK